jgi:hypothetical protein
MRSIEISSFGKSFTVSAMGGCEIASMVAPAKMHFSLGKDNQNSHKEGRRIKLLAARAPQRHFGSSRKSSNSRNEARMVALNRTGIFVLSISLLAACKGGDAGKVSDADASTPVWPLSTKSDEARAHIEQGERANDEGRYLDAYEQFKRAVASDSAFAYAYQRVSDFSQSFDEYKTNLERAKAYETTANPTEKLLIDIGQRLFVRDQDGALELAQQLVTLQPKNPRSYWTLSTQQFYGSGNTSDARASAQRAIDVAPGYGLAHLFLGTLWLNAPKDVAKAEHEVLAGQRLWPDKPISYDYLGDVRRAQGRLKEAAEAYSRQIELAPKQRVGYEQRGHAETFLGEYDKARADYDAATRLGKRNEPVASLEDRAYVEIYAGNPAASLTQLDQLFHAIDGMGIPEPDGAKINVLFDEETIATHIRKFDVAARALASIDSLEKKFADKSGNADYKRQTEGDIAMNDARFAAFTGDYPKMREKIASYTKLTAADRNPTKNRRVHAVLGFAALFQKKYDEAVREFLQGDPDSIYEKYHRALALEGAGHTAEAKALFKEVADYNFNSAEYALVRADAVARSK